MNTTVSFTTNQRHPVKYDGPLDFAFILHPRSIPDILRTYPHLCEETDDHVIETIARHSTHVCCSVEAHFNGSLVRGEVIAVPFLPREFRNQPRNVRESLFSIFDYCSTRQTRIIGLGGLLPSITRFGSVLAERSGNVGITTGHSFTAYSIAEYVRQIESLLGSTQSIAIVGAAGSTGRAIILALFAHATPRRFTLVDLPQRLPSLSEVIPPPDQEIVISADLSAIRHSSLVICVTNATKAIIQPEFLRHGCIVIDDAQPENISFEAARHRPDVIVIKCLARIPRLECPYDFGLFPHPPNDSTNEIAFTCLAETIALAASNHVGHFTIGSPTPKQINHIGEMAFALGISIAPFHSFPEIGTVHDHPRFQNHARTPNLH